MDPMLKKIFPSIITYEEGAKDNYKWFQTHDGDIVGIHEEELSKREYDLLSVFMKPYLEELPTRTKRETEWYKLLHDGDNTITSDSFREFRFTYFTFPPLEMDKHFFKEAIQNIFDEHVSVLWESDGKGIIIEEKEDLTSDAIQFEQIIDILINDLNVNIRFCTGPFTGELDAAMPFYKWITKHSADIFTTSKKKVTSYIDAMPHLIMKHTDDELVADLGQMIFRHINDEEMIHTIETFIQCNLNISITAKKMFMHRNSVQYRIDKFCEKTGIDIRQFQQAVPVYLAIITHMQEG